MLVVKYIYFAGFSDYWKITNNDLYHRNDVFVCDGIKNSLLDKVSRIHNSWKLNKKKELPLKSIWFSFYSAAGKFRKDQKQFAIFAEDNSLSFSAKYLKYLRRKYPKLVMIFNFSNPCGEYNLSKLKRVEQYYDHIITFNQTDNEQYGFELLPINGYSKLNVPKSNIPESDLFFVGQDKGRLPILLALHDRLSELGLKCLFSVVNVKAEDVIPRSGIVYNRRMSYMEVLQHVEKTKCVLELLEGDSNYSSIRTTEALVYGKKLITMSKRVLNSIHYSPSQMLCIESPEEITKEFFETPIENDYDISDFSPAKGLAEIEKLERRKS